MSRSTAAATLALMTLALVATDARADKKLDEAIAKADEQLLKSKPEEAEKTLQKLVPAGGPEAYLALARLQLRLGKEDEAGQNLATAQSTLATSTPTVKSQVLSALAEYNLIAGSSQEALARAREAVAAEPSARALSTLARAQARASEAGALATAEKAVAADAASSDAQTAKGEALLASNQWAQAEAAFREAKRLDAHSATAEIGLSRALSEQGKHVEAAAEATKATELDSHSAEAFATLAHVLIKQDPQKNWPAAIAHAQNGAFENPKSARAFIAVGEIFEASGNYTQSQENYSKALAIDPKLTATRLAVVKMQMRRDPKNAAAEACRLAAEMPESGDVQMMCASAYLFANDNAKAIPYLEKAARLSPGLVDAHRYLATAYFFTNQADKAVAPCKTAAELDPKNVELLASCGLIVAKGGDSPSAVKFLSDATRLDPRNTSSWMNLGWVYRSMKPAKADEAVAAYGKALELEPKNLQAALGMGWANVYAERWPPAVAAFTKAIEIDPKAAGDAYYGIARTWYFQEDMAKTREFADKAAAAGRDVASLKQDVEKFEKTVADAAARQKLREEIRRTAITQADEGDSLPSLIQKVNYGNAAAKRAACHDLAGFGAQAAREMGAVLRREPDLSVRQACLQALCTMGAKGAGALPAMEILIADPPAVNPNATPDQVKQEQAEADLIKLMKDCVRRIKS
jgi:tetratricopeptide (TPR) repeat protein